MSKTDVRNRQLNIRLSEEEAAKVMRAAENAGLPVSAYARRLVVGQKVKPMVIDREQGKQLIAALGKMGSNLNQIAKVANQGGGVDADALARLHEDIGDFWAYILDGKKPQRESEPRRSAPMSAHGHGEQQAENVSHESSKAPICKGCGAVMRLCYRKQDGKPFWGCPNFRSGGNHSVFDVEG